MTKKIEYPKPNFGEEYERQKDGGELPSFLAAPQAEEYDQTAREAVERVADTFEQAARALTGIENEINAQGDAIPKNEGIKFDTEKLPYHLVPPELDAAVAAVLGYGAQKYTARNWERGMDWSRPYAALMRHMTAWWGGEGRDPETGMSHLWHAGCCIAFLIAYEAREIGTDDRPVDMDPNKMWSPGFFTAVMESAIAQLEKERDT